MGMCWLLCIIGLVMTILGAFLYASNEDVEIKGCTFDSEVLGMFFASIGGILAALMLIALCVNWLGGLSGV
jgi:hypothetical protein